MSMKAEGALDIGDSLVQTRAAPWLDIIYTADSSRTATSTTATQTHQPQQHNYLLSSQDNIQYRCRTLAYLLVQRVAVVDLDVLLISVAY